MWTCSNRSHPWTPARWPNFSSCLFEAFSNVLQHAHASTLRVSARPLDAQGTGVRLQVIDNRRRFDPARPGRRGLLSMHERARAIGVTLQLHSAPGRTVVEITIA